MAGLAANERLAARQSDGRLIQAPIRISQLDKTIAS